MLKQWLSSAFVALLLLGAVAPASAATSAEELAKRSEVLAELARGEEPGAPPKFAFQYGTREDPSLPRRFLVFLRTDATSENVGDAELVVVAVRKKGSGITAERIFRDVSVLGLRSSRRAALTERELQSILRASGFHDQARRGGHTRYLAYAKSRLSAGDLSKDERWIFDEVLGPGWERTR